MAKLIEKNLVDIQYGKETVTPSPAPVPAGTAGGAKDFEAFHLYSDKTIIFHDNHLYRANYAFKSADIFDPVDWEQVAINDVQWSQIQGDITEQEDLQAQFSAIETSTDEKLALKVDKAGDTMTGPLVLNAAPTTDDMAANKQYVDETVSQLESQALTFIGFVSTTEPTVDVREGNFWYQPASAEEIPDVTFPWQVKTYTSGAWSVDTIPYTPSALDMWDNLDSEQSYFYFGDGWKILDFNGSTFDPAKFEVVNGVVKIKSGAIVDADIAANAQIQASKISGLDEQLAVFSEGVKGTIVGASESDGIGYVKAMPDGKGKVSGLVEMNSLLTMGPPDMSQIEGINRISTNNGTWTADRDGYALVSFYSGNGDSAPFSFQIDGVVFFRDIQSSSTTLRIISPPFKKGSVLKIVSEGNFNNCSCYFIPPVINPPAYLETMPLLDYSTVEQDTGRKWIDGKTIYQKTISYNNPATIQAGYDIEIPLGETIINVIDAIVSVSRGTATNQSINKIGSVLVGCSPTNSSVLIYFYPAIGFCIENSGKITVWYTK